MTASEIKSPEELNYARPLDVHTWSGYPEVNRFIDNIHDNHFSDPLSNIRKKHLKVVLLDLYVAWVGDPNLCIAIHMNERKYRSKTRYNTLHISKTTISVVKALTKLGLIYSHPGFHDRREGGLGRVSRIWPSERLIQHFRKARFSIFAINYHEDRECIVLRDENKKDIEYEDTPETRSMREVLSSYNRLLRDTHIDCSHLDQPYVSKKDGSCTQINQNKKFVRRVFNNSSWKQGGRFYGGWWQQIGSDNRSGIRINGKRTIEIDYTGLHIVLLYARVGINYFDHYGSSADPYEITVPRINDPVFTRWLAKTILLVAVNAPDETTAFRAIRQTVGDEGYRPKGLSLTDALLREVLDKLKDNHPLIKDSLCSGAGIDLQYTDSQITEQIIEYFTLINVPVLAVHDSYVIQEDYADVLHDRMSMAWDKETPLKAGPREWLDTLSPQGTKAVQRGYVDELLVDDPEEHEKIIKMKEAQYVSKRYDDGLKAFRAWRSEKGVSNGI